jgi:hypothetical protein
MQVPYLHPTEAYYLEQDVIMNCWSCINTTPAKDGPLAYVPTEGIEGLRAKAISQVSSNLGISQT